MTETTEPHPLASAFARPKLIAVGCVVALAALGWLYLALAIADMNGPIAPDMGVLAGLPRAVQVLCRPLFGESVPVQGLLLIARHLIASRHVLRRLPHRHVGGRELLGEARIGQRIEAAHRHAAHRFDAAADECLARVELDRARRHVDRLHR